MIKLILVLTVSLIILSGCGSAPKKAEAMPVLEQTMVIKIPVVSMDLSQASQTLCPKMGTDMSRKKIKDLVQMGNSCVRIQEFGRLEEVGNTINKKEPFQPWGSFFLSIAAEARGEIQRAKWMIELALKKNNSYGILHFQKGRLLWLDKQYAEALQFVKKAVGMDPGLVEGHLFLGQVYFRDQEFDVASEHFYAVLKARASDMVALSGLAESRRLKGDFRGSMEVLNRAIVYYPGVIEFQWRQAQIYETNLNDKINALNSYIQLKRKLIKNPSKIISLVEVENKIQQLEKSQRAPAVSSKTVVSGKGVKQ